MCKVNSLLQPKSKEYMYAQVTYMCQFQCSRNCLGINTTTINIKQPRIEEKKN